MNIWTRRLAQGLLFLPAVLFTTMGLRWLVNPAGVAPELGLTLQTGVGLSSQVGDLAGFFLVLGLCIMTALVSGRRTWYYPPAMLLLFAALGRVVAWVVHDAALVPQMIVVELVVGTLLLAASRYLPNRD